MDRERYIELDNSGTGLTKEEWEAGWHWCYEWDGMLVGPNTPEALCCSCSHPAIEAWKKTPEAEALMKEETTPDAEPHVGDDALDYFKKLTDTENTDG